MKICIKLYRNKIYCRLKKNSWGNASEITHQNVLKQKRNSSMLRKRRKEIKAAHIYEWNAAVVHCPTRKHAIVSSIKNDTKIKNKRR